MVAFVPGRITRSQTGSGSPGATMTSRTSGSIFSGIEIVEIADARQQRDGDDRLAARRISRCASAMASSAGRRAACGEKRDQAQRRPAGFLRDQVHAIREKAGVATKLVDEKAAHHVGVGRIEHRMRADEARDDAAAIDVADQHHRHIRPRAAKPILAMSPARRLISAGLPAPSTSTRSASLASSRKTIQHDGISCGLIVLIVSRLSVPPAICPAR